MSGFIAIIFLCTLIHYSVSVPPRYDYSGGIAEVEGVRDCYGISCPEGTVACSKLSKSTKDTMYVDVVIKCEDSDGNSLNTDTRREDNPFPGTRMSSFSYQGNYKVRLVPKGSGTYGSRSGTGLSNPSLNTNLYNGFNTNNKDVEVFGDQGF